MKIAIVGALIALGLSLSACATVTEGRSDPFEVTSTPVDGAKCVLKNGVGSWYLTTPGSAEVHKSKTDLNIDCTREGYQPAHMSVASHFEGMTAGNLLIGGVVGITVDAASGAINHYSKGVQIVLVPLDGTPPPPVSSLMVQNDNQPYAEHDLPTMTLAGGDPKKPFARTPHASKIKKLCHAGSPCGSVAVTLPRGNRYCGYWYSAPGNHTGLNIDPPAVQSGVATVMFDGSQQSDLTVDVTIWSVHVPSDLPEAETTHACDLSYYGIATIKH